jgi:HSP20 family protein
MTLSKHEAPKPVDAFDRLFGHWPDLFHRPVFWWPGDWDGMIHVDEYQENGTLVIRADIAGIDPSKDVEITVADGVLHVKAERKAAEETEDKTYYRKELRYGSFVRDLALPEGCSEEDLKATYRDGVLEIRVPNPTKTAKKEPKRISISA